MKATAFISHFDCSRHDTGWQHPDHQGRLPGLMRAVHADMLTLFDPLLEVEGRHASDFELRRLHPPEYLARVRAWDEEGSVRGETIEPVEGVRISGASWDAATAAVGSVLAGIATVMAGEARNAFCAIRPPGRYVTADQPGGFGLLNTVALPAIHLLKERRLGRVLILEWGGPGGSPTARLLDGLAADVGGVYRTDPDSPPAAASRWRVDLPALAGAPAFHLALEEVLGEAGRTDPDFVILSAGFDGMAGDPLGDLGLSPLDFYHATVRVRELADAKCDGRLVSVLEGGFDARSLGAAAVQHLRALAGVEAAA